VPDPDKLLEQISPKLFDEWAAYCMIEPFGEDWRQTAEICATQLNSVGGGKVSGGLFTAKDMPFMPREQTDETEEIANEKIAETMHAEQWRAFSARQQARTGQTHEAGLAVPH
jgi:hypothetical protein